MRFPTCRQIIVWLQATRQRACLKTTVPVENCFAQFNTFVDRSVADLVRAQAAKWTTPVEYGTPIALGGLF